MPDSESSQTGTLVTFWTVVLVLLTAFALVEYSARPHTAEGNPAGTWVGLVTVKSSKDGPLEPEMTTGVGNAVLRLRLRNSWLPGHTEYEGRGDLCDAGGSKWDFETYSGSFRHPEQFVTSVATNAPLGGTMWVSYTKDDLRIKGVAEYQFNMTGTVRRGDDDTFSRACAALKVHDRYKREAPYTP